MNGESDQSERGDEPEVAARDPEAVEAIAIEALAHGSGASTATDDRRPILEWADARSLSLDDRVRLFARIARLLDADHRLGQIHGALDPGRILVDDDGTPILIGPDPSGFDPEYASPEQVIGEPVTTAVDIHALGAILYRLLTGLGPYRLRSLDLDELYPAICEQAPDRPSRSIAPRMQEVAAAFSIPDRSEIARLRGTTPARLRKALVGDLDAIVLRALRKEPERRYETAGQLADDLHAHLEGRAVRARGDAIAYRMRTFVQRHRRVAALAAIVAVLIVGGVAGLGRGLGRARLDRDRAELARREAREAVDRSVDGVLDDLRLDQPGMERLRADLLRVAGDYYDQSLVEAGGRPADPLDRARTLTRLARIAAATDPPALADVPYRRAVEAWETLLAGSPGIAEYQEGLAGALEGRASVLLGLDGRLDEASEVCRLALGRIDEAIAAESSPSRRRLRALILRDAAEARSRAGSDDEAIAALRSAIEAASALLDHDPNAIGPREWLAASCSRLGRILARRPNGLAPAIDQQTRAVEVEASIVRDRPELVGPSDRLAASTLDLALTQAMAGRLDSALATGQRAVEILEGLDRRYPEAVAYRERRARAENFLADLHRRRGEPAEAMAMAEKARPILEKLVENHPDDGSRVELARTYNILGRLHRQDGQPVEALKAFRHAVDLLENLDRPVPADQFDLACNLALCVSMVGARPGTQGADDDEVVEPAEVRRRKLYGDRALEVLRKAGRGGAFTAQTLLDTDDLAAIRRRDDFRQLLDELSTKK